MRKRTFLAAAAAAGALTAAAPGIYGQLGGRKVRIAVVGGGSGAAFHWHLHPASAGVAVCDLRDERLKVLKDTYRCDALYKDYKRLLKHRGLEAVAIFTPPHLHVPMALDALAAGKHVISAVPAGLSEAELEELLAAVK